MRYAKLFTSKKGNVVKPLRLGLEACIIQSEYGTLMRKLSHSNSIPVGFASYFCVFPDNESVFHKIEVGF